MSIIEALTKKRPTAENVRTTIATLETKLEQASTKAEQVEAELNAALLAHEEGSIQQAELAKTRKAAEAARQILQDTQGSLTAARRRLADAEAQEAQSEKEAARQAALDLMAERVKVARKLEKDAATLAGSINRLHELGYQIREVSYKIGLGSGQIDTAACLIGPTDTFDAIRETLWLHEIEVNGPFSKYELERRPSLVEKLETAKNFMEAQA